MQDTPNADDVANDSPTHPVPDPHGYAALLLVESLIHGMVDRSVLTASEALEIVEVAADAEAEIASDKGESPDATRPAQLLLSSIAASLRIDAQ